MLIPIRLLLVSTTITRRINTTHMVKSTTKSRLTMEASITNRRLDRGIWVKLGRMNLSIRPWTDKKSLTRQSLESKLKKEIKKDTMI
jgi:hypothetical protein